MDPIDHTNEQAPTPGDRLRAYRHKVGLTLNEVSLKTGLAVSTLSKLEKGRVSLSYDKLMVLGKGLGVDIAQLLDTAAPTMSASARGARRVVHRAGEGQLVETHSYRQHYLATELKNKQFTPLIGEPKLRTIEAFFDEFGDYIRHPGEEFFMVLDGVVEFHTETYAPLTLQVGDSVYFDSEMGHAYLNGSDQPCRLVAICSARGMDAEVPDSVMLTASEKRAKASAAARAPTGQAVSHDLRRGRPA